MVGSDDSAVKTVFPFFKHMGKNFVFFGFFFQAEDGIRDTSVTGVQTCALPILNILDPTRGSATLLGVDSRKISPRELAEIGYVSENQDMPARLTVGEYVAYLRPFYSKIGRASCRERG